MIDLFNSAPSRKDNSAPASRDEAREMWDTVNRLTSQFSNPELRKHSAREELDGIRKKLEEIVSAVRDGATDLLGVRGFSEAYSASRRLFFPEEAGESQIQRPEFIDDHSSRSIFVPGFSPPPGITGFTYDPDRSW